MRVDLVLNKPVAVPAFGAGVTVTLVRADLAFVVDPVSPARSHQLSGTLEVHKDGTTTSLTYPNGAGLSYDGHRFSVQGMDGWYELKIAN